MPETSPELGVALNTKKKKTTYFIRQSERTKKRWSGTKCVWGRGLSLWLGSKEIMLHPDPNPDSSAQLPFLLGSQCASKSFHLTQERKKHFRKFSKEKQSSKFKCFQSWREVELKALALSLANPVLNPWYPIRSLGTTGGGGSLLSTQPWIAPEHDPDGHSPK